MRREAVVEALESIALLLELKGENPFKVRAYAQAARAIEQAPDAPATLVDTGRLRELAGIGPAIAERIEEMVRTGRSAYHEQLRAEFPAGVFALLDVPGLGPKRVKTLYERLGVDSPAALDAVCRDGRAAALPGFGARLATRILEALARRREFAGQYLPARIGGDVQALLEALRACPVVSRAIIAGSLRRATEVVRDVDVIVSTTNPAEAIDFFARLPLVDEVLLQGDTKCSARLRCGPQCDLRAVRTPEFPFALAYFTGSKEHNIRMRARALERGWTLNEYRLAHAADRAPASPSPAPIPDVDDEPALYAALGLQYVPPELREDRGEIEVAARGELPRLVELGHLRGTFHCHTTASDGNATLEEMARAADDLGLQYLGIADHSRGAVQANGLDAERLMAQRSAIEQWNRRGEGVRLFAGVECDILKDGTLDFPDEILARLDYVVASVHSSFGLSEAAMTARIVRAMTNPHVTMLGHPTGRLLLERDPYRVDLAAVIDAAADTGTIIELNCNPRRLDLDWRWWPRARARGVRCAINPDAHAVQDLGFLKFGAGAARKGWLTRVDVVNCLPLGQIEGALGRKRTGA